MNYKLSTPKLDTSSGDLYESRFDYEQFIGFVNKIMKLPLQRRIYDNGQKVMTLEGFKVNEDADFYEGYFTSARYGEVTNLVHRKTFEKRQSDKTVDEGDENNIYFVIEKNTGMLFLQNDSKRLVTKNAIHRYFRNYLNLFEEEIKTINKRIFPLIVAPNNFFTISTIYSTDFYNEIRNLIRIKKATFIISYKENTNSDVVNAIRKSSDMVTGVDEIEYTIKNKERGGSMKSVEKFLRNLEEIDKYENVIVEGPEEGGGRNKAVKLEDHPKVFPIEVNVNANGIINFNDLITGIIKIAKTD